MSVQMTDTYSSPQYHESGENAPDSMRTYPAAPAKMIICRNGDRDKKRFC